MNVDEDDITRHETIKEWWDIKGPMMGLHAMNVLRISLIRDGLGISRKLKENVCENEEKYLKGLKIIDVGCGVGILSEPLARLGADVVGIDPSQQLIDIAKQHAANDEILFMTSQPTYLVSTIEEHSFDNCNVYDVLIASEVVEHVPNKQQFLEACVKAVKPGGSIFFTTPNRTYLSWFANIFLAENVIKLLPKGIHEFDKFIRPSELKEVLKNLGCTTVSVYGMVFNILNKKWFWSITSVLHYATHAVKERPSK